MHNHQTWYLNIFCRRSEIKFTKKIKFALNVYFFLHIIANIYHGRLFNARTNNSKKVIDS